LCKEEEEEEDNRRKLLWQGAPYFGLLFFAMRFALGPRLIVVLSLICGLALGFPIDEDDDGKIILFCIYLL
jgi:hypothetical protein